jgi:hypothetical protein
MLPRERHSRGSGHTMHGIAASYSAWPTPIACVGVVALFRWGCWLFPACPRTCLLANVFKAGPLPSSALSCTLSSVLRTPRTPSRLRPFSAFRPSATANPETPRWAPHDSPHHIYGAIIFVYNSTLQGLVAISGVEPSHLLTVPSGDKLANLRDAVRR